MVGSMRPAIDLVLRPENALFRTIDIGGDRIRRKIAWNEEFT